MKKKKLIKISTPCSISFISPSSFRNIYDKTSQNTAPILLLLLLLHLHLHLLYSIWFDLISLWINHEILEDSLEALWDSFLIPVTFSRGVRAILPSSDSFSKPLEPLTDAFNWWEIRFFGWRLSPTRSASNWLIPIDDEVRLLFESTFAMNNRNLMGLVSSADRLTQRINKYFQLLSKTPNQSVRRMRLERRIWVAVIELFVFGRESFVLWNRWEHNHLKANGCRRKDQSNSKRILDGEYWWKTTHTQKKIKRRKEEERKKERKKEIEGEKKERKKEKEKKNPKTLNDSGWSCKLKLPNFHH